MNDALLVELTYEKNLWLRYHNLHHLPGFVFLGSSDTKLGRYDILTACPYDRFVIPRNVIDKSARIEQLKAKLNLYSLPNKGDLPFVGGAIGYISYDLGAELNDIVIIPQPSLAAMPLLDLAFYDWAIIVDHLQNKVYLYSANQQPSTSDIIKEVLDLWHQRESPLSSIVIKGNFAPLITRQQYYDSFMAIQTALVQGRCYQVNFTQAFHAEYEGDTWQMYHQVSKSNPVPFSAYLRSSDADILSFSPERFLLHYQGKLLTSPIKGTIRRSSNPKEDKQLMKELLSSAKNRAENVMIVDLLRNDLGRVAKAGSVEVLNLCALQSFRSVHHLVSDIVASPVEVIHPIDLFLACFPGGSITGAPKLEAMRVINEQEMVGRGIYCGSIAYFSRCGRFDSNIAIRTITATNDLLHLAAGGGIVIDSQWEDEYRECFIKIEAIINGLR